MGHAETTKQNGPLETTEEGQAQAKATKVQH
jgi:hypothetical protein